MTQTFVPSIRPVTSSRSPEALIKKGRKLLSEKRFDEALVEFEEVLKTNQATAAVHNMIGRIKYKKQEFDSAMQHFQTSIAMDPTHAQPYLRSARIHLLRQQTEQAREALLNAVRVNAKSAMAYAGLGLVSLRQQQLDAAIEYLQKALSFNPRLLIVRRRLALALCHAGRMPDAFAQILSALRIDPADAESHAIKGQLHLLEHQYDQALQAYEQAAALDPEDRRQSIRMGLAQACIQTGDIERAEQLLNTMPQRENSALLHKMWGDIYTSRQMHREALEEYRSAALLADATSLIGDLADLDLDLLAEDADEDRLRARAISARDASMRLMALKKTGADASGSAAS